MQNSEKSLNLYYDLAHAPNSYDFGVFLSIGITVGRASGFDGFRSVIVADRFRRTGAESEFSDQYSAKKLVDIFPAIAQLFPQINQFEISRCRDKCLVSPYFPRCFGDPMLPQISASSPWPHNFIHLEQLYKRYGSIALIKIERELAGDSSYVTISPRGGAMNKARNTSNEVLREAINSARSVYKGKRIVLVPDKESLGAVSSLDSDIEVSWAAGVSLIDRMQLYAAAEVNILFSSGPSALVLLSEFPFIFLGMLNSKVPISSRDYFRRKGPSFGLQLPWLRGDQVIDWNESDKYRESGFVANILRSYEKARGT